MKIREDDGEKTHNGRTFGFTVKESSPADRDPVRDDIFVSEFFNSLVMLRTPSWMTMSSSFCMSLTRSTSGKRSWNR
jgi:hypothetical protein